VCTWRAHGHRVRAGRRARFVNVVVIAIDLAIAFAIEIVLEIVASSMQSAASSDRIVIAPVHNHSDLP
jgi:hypothetical protein